MLVRSSTLILWAIASAFFPRVLGAIGFPSAINFLHFLVVPLACGIALGQARSRSRILALKPILIGLVLLLLLIIASSTLNGAGAINAVLDYVLLIEPFILVLGIISLRLTSEQTHRFRLWIVRFALVNILFAMVQKFVLRLDRFSGPDGVGGDNIKGVFLHQGAGHVIGASVSMTFAVYYFAAVKKHPLWMRIAVLVGAVTQVIASDAKQVLLAFLVALMLLMATKFTNIGQAIRYMAIAGLFIALIIWAANTVFPALNTWIRPEIYGPDGEATQLKLAGFRIIPTFYDSPLNWFFGLGPGHTIGRLGGWMLREYSALLEPLGSTTSPATGAVWAAVGASWLGNQSSMFSPLFGWAGIWGDLGLLGLAAYLYLWLALWHQLSRDDVSKYIMLTVFVFGLIFSQLEEPAYTLFVGSLLGLRWQERHSHQTLPYRRPIHSSGSNNLEAPIINASR